MFSNLYYAKKNILTHYGFKKDIPAHDRLKKKSCPEK